MNWKYGRSTAAASVFLSSFTHLHEKINIVRACLVINRFDATVPAWGFGFCQTINWKYVRSTAAVLSVLCPTLLSFMRRLT